MATRYSIEEVDEASQEEKEIEQETQDNPPEEKPHETPEKHHTTHETHEHVSSHGIKQEKVEEEKEEGAKSEDLQSKTEPEDIASAKTFWSPDEVKNGFEHNVNYQSTPPQGNKRIHPKIEQKNRNSKNVLWIILIVLGVALMAGGGFWYWQMKNQAQPEATPISAETPAPTPVATPQAAQTETPNYSKYKAQVLNGSGTSGEAGKVESILTNLGFSGIDTGNAKNFSYKKTELQTKKDTPQDVVDGVKKALEDKYQVEVTQTLDKNSKYDMVIIVGSQAAQ